MIVLFRLKLRAARLMWPATLLALLLQRTPVLRILADTEFAAGVRVMQLLRAMLPTAAVLGAVNTLTGQSAMIFNPTSPVSGTVGEPLAVAFAFTGGPVTPESYAIIGTLPPGMSVTGGTGAAGNITLNSNAGSITGTPTSAGQFNVTVEAFDDANRGTGTYGSSGPVTLTFNIASGTSPPAFTTHPVSQTVNQGGNVTFTVVATGGPPPTLQWRKDSVNITGETGATLTLNNVTTANAGSYDCVATNASGSQTSNAATLTVNVPPAFTLHPATQTVTAGTNVTFTVAVTGSPAPTLQWRKDGNNLAGATGLSLTLNNVANADEGSYTCVATNAAGNATSNAATLTVNVTPAFTTHPATQTVNYRAGVTFTVVATGDPVPTLQWRKDGTPLAGQTGASLTLDEVLLADAGAYDCVATNSVSSVASNAATLTVTPPAAPTIQSQPAAITSLVNSGAFFSVAANGVELTYQWRKDGVDIVGATGISLFLAGVQAGDAGAYSVRITNPGGFIDSDAVALNVVTSGQARLANLSARAQVGTGGNILIPGFFIGGSGNKQLLVRGVGRKLEDLGVTEGYLADPSMTLFSGNTPIGTNDNWQDFADQTLLETIRSSEGAFVLTPYTTDAAMVVNVSAGGPYTAHTSGVGGTTGIALVELYDADPFPSTTALVNISARAQVGTGGDILIPGFVIEGDVALTVLIRGVGPKLVDLGVAVEDVLPDPVMTLFQGATPILSNDDWEQSPDSGALADAAVATSAFALPAGGKDAALLVSLNPGSYTVHVAGKDGTTGVALMEIYLVGP